MARSGGRAAIALCAAVLVSVTILLSDPPAAAQPRRRTTTVRPTTTTVPAVPAATLAAVRAEADWVLQAVLPDGAIAHYVDRARIWPYLSNFAALGLARAAQLTGDTRYSTAAWRWLAWYQAHMDANGFVTDYVLTDEVATSTGDMDSTDAYAGTFLLATRRIWKATGDTSRLRTLQPGIVKAVSAIEATQDTDGLTWAKPTWKAKYLMDQAETWAGLRAAVELAGVLGDTALASRAGEDAARMKAGVDALWNPATGAYDWAVHENGVRQTTRWNVLYPDALQQTWAVAFGLTTGARSTELADRFLAAQPGFDQPSALAIVDGGTKMTGYWPVAAWALQRAGRSARAATAATNILGGALATDRAWPYTPANAGQLVTLLSSDPDYLAP